MAASEAELEQKFTEMLTSRAATAPRGAIGELDPHPRAGVRGRTAGPRPRSSTRPEPGRGAATPQAEWTQAAA